jgi:Asp-tRNA(Asn)/Glu-tRNA(Gln) amidotransferase A subunit family amidase
LPYGIQLMSADFEEDLLFHAAHKIQEVLWNSG